MKHITFEEAKSHLRVNLEAKIYTHKDKRIQLLKEKYADVYWLHMDNTILQNPDVYESVDWVIE